MAPTLSKKWPRKSGALATTHSTIIALEGRATITDFLPQEGNKCKSCSIRRVHQTYNAFPVLTKKAQPGIGIP